MISLLADADSLGHAARLVATMHQEPWREFSAYLGLTCITFENAGLDPTDSDDVVWQRCQDNGLVLLTGNRNDDGPTSLETTIRSRNTLTSLPVITISRLGDVLTDGYYAERVIDRLLQYLLDLDRYRGSGRLYVP